MRTNAFTEKKSFILSSTILLLAIGFLLSSCNNESKNDNNQAFDYVSAAMRQAPLPVKLKKGQIKWSQTQGKQVNYLNFFTTYNRPKGEMEVEVQAYDATYNRVGQTMRLIKRNKNPVHFPSIGIDQNIIQITNLPILDGSGKLIAFDSLQLTPDVFTDTRTGQQYLRYAILIFNNGISSKDVAYSLPCPPCWNCKPREATCVDVEARSTSPVADTTKKTVVDTARSK